MRLALLCARIPGKSKEGYALFRYVPRKTRSFGYPAALSEISHSRPKEKEHSALCSNRVKFIFPFFKPLMKVLLISLE